MQFIDCPGLGRRALSEFVVAGDVAPVPEALEGCSAGTQAFIHDGTAGWRDEWWYHTPTARWFIVHRDTASNVIDRVRAAALPVRAP